MCFELLDYHVGAFFRRVIICIDRDVVGVLRDDKRELALGLARASVAAFFSRLRSSSGGQVT